MVTTNQLVIDIARQTDTVTHDRGVRPETLQVGAAVLAAIWQIAADRIREHRPGLLQPVHNIGMGGAITMLGMAVEEDQYLPPEVWRLTDRHGTLLYDCRQGKVVP